MYVECYDEDGAAVYDMILRYTLQDLQLARAIQAIKVFIDPREALFIGVVKLEKTSTSIYLPDIAHYKMEDDDLKITVDDENYIPHLLKALWKSEGRSNVLQPDRYKMVVKNPSFNPDTLLVHNPTSELKRKVYDALFRIMPEGFRMTRNASEGNLICLMSSDEIIDEKWNVKFQEVIDEVKNQ